MLVTWNEPNFHVYLTWIVFFLHLVVTKALLAPFDDVIMLVITLWPLEQYLCMNILCVNAETGENGMLDIISTSKGVGLLTQAVTTAGGFSL